MDESRNGGQFVQERLSLAQALGGRVREVFLKVLISLYFADSIAGNANCPISLGNKRSDVLTVNEACRDR